MLHEIALERGAVHGYFSRERRPVVTVESGDAVHLRTLHAGWSVEQRLSEAPEARPAKFPHDPSLDSGHALTGPIAVRGARPGMALGVRVDALRVGTWGVNTAGGWDNGVNERLGMGAGEETYLLWTLDPDGLTGRDQHGHTLPLLPFLGVIGMPPDEPGVHSTVPPRPCGGNIDCKELVAGSTLYLPVAVPGALLSVSDGHALQADGEVSSTAIECPMERVQLTLTLHPDLHLTTPRARTPVGWLTFGFHEDLDEAMLIALDAMLDLMGEMHGLGRREAMALASLVVDLRITQVVNGVRGVHAVLPYGALG